MFENERCPGKEKRKLHTCYRLQNAQEGRNDKVEPIGLQQTANDRALEITKQVM